MSGFWYTAAIATASSALFTAVVSFSQDLNQNPTVGRVTASIRHLSPSAPPSNSKSDNTQSNIASVTGLPSIDDIGQQRYNRAIELANHAVFSYQAARKEKDPVHSLAFTHREQRLWQATLQILGNIPRSADIHPQAVEKKTQYQTLLNTAESKLNADNSEFLAPIIDAAKVSSGQVHITLCQIGTSVGPLEKDLSDREDCRHHQGDQPMASAASLIKLPIAIALMDKVNEEGIDLDQKIYIDPGNFTENAAGANVEVNQQYSLSQVMTRMINQSNNIATNQLIDYVGREHLAKTMAKRGYSSTLVDHKLAGDRILPANPGSQSNRTTTHDITAMMAHTYGLENPGDEVLLTALASQIDREFGHQALRDLGSNIRWLGEKTGQNNRVIGSTLAMIVNNERYVLTVAIDYSADPEAMRSLISGIATHIAQTGPLVDPQGR